MKIAVLDDDLNHLKLVESVLRGAHSVLGVEPSCVYFSSGQEMMSAVRREPFDVLILDRQVPDMSGDVILQYLRQYSQKYIPVVMLSNLRRENDVVQGLQAGADEYMTKPFAPKELLFRVQRLIRRSSANRGTNSSPAASANNFSVGMFKFNGFDLTVTFNDQVVKLTEREFALATILFKNIGVNVSRQALIQAGWGKDSLQNRTLETHIHNVREKLELNAENGWQLRSIYGFGYRLNSSVL